MTDTITDAATTQPPVSPEPTTDPYTAGLHELVLLLPRIRSAVDRIESVEATIQSTASREITGLWERLHGGHNAPVDNPAPEPVSPAVEPVTAPSVDAASAAPIPNATGSHKQ